MERRSLVMSVGLHVSVALLAWIGLPNLKRDLPDEQPLVVMEIVQTVPKTNLTVGEKPSTAKQEQTPTKRPTPPPPTPPRPKPPAPKPPAPKPAPKPVKPAAKAPDAKAEVLPEKLRIKPKAKPAVAQPPAPPKPKPKKTATQKAPEKMPQPSPVRENKVRENKLAQKKARQEQQAKALSGVMQNLAKARAVAKEAEKDKRDKARKIAAEKLANNLSAAAGQAVRAPEKPVVGPMGLDDIDRIRQHVSGCWSPPIGTAGADRLNVDIIVTLDRDGKVLTAEVENKMRMTVDRTFRVAAEEAIRTMFKCSPLPVPPEKYEQWKSFIFGFDPKFLSR
jgi:hypothetical protein